MAIRRKVSIFEMFNSCQLTCNSEDKEMSIPAFCLEVHEYIDKHLNFIRQQ